MARVERPGARASGAGALALTLALACGRAPDEPVPATAPLDPIDERVPLDVAAPPRSAGPAHGPSPAGGEPAPFAPGPGDAPPTHFEGREIAATMSASGASWLDRPERDAEEDATRLHDALGLRAGQTACDVGAGSGYHTLRLARAVGPQGRVLAVDLQPRMLEMLRERVAAAGLSNVEAIEASEADPRLPASTCDLILLVDVYHELAWPEPMLAAFRRALAPGGRLALVEFRAEDPSVPIKRLHTMSKVQIDRELLPRGFRRVETFDGLPWQHLVIFARDEEPAR